MKVFNRGYKTRDQKWKNVEGKVKFFEPTNKGQLKVSFSDPFYSGYNIIDLDKVNFQYAMVA